MNNQIKCMLVVVLSVMGSCFAAKVSVKPNGCKGPVLCPQYPVYGKQALSCGTWGGRLEVGLLWQQPWVFGTIAGSKSVGSKFPDGTNINGSSLVLSDIEECFDYSFGVTADIGFMIEHDDWYIGAHIDWLSGNINNRVYKDTGTFYYIENSLNDAVGFLTSIILNADTSLSNLIFNANIDMYLLDFVISRGSFHSKRFSYEPFAGIKTLWYNGRYSTKTNDSSGAGIANLMSEYGVTTTFDAWGVGPSFGVKGEYYILDLVSIFSKSDIGILYGELNFAVNGDGDFIFGVNSPLTTDLTDKRNSKQEFFIPVRTIVGLKYGKLCMEEEYYFSGEVGYDARYVFARAVAPDVGASGLIFTLTWDY